MVTSVVGPQAAAAAFPVAVLTVRAGREATAPARDGGAAAVARPRVLGAQVGRSGVGRSGVGRSGVLFFLSDFLATAVRTLFTRIGAACILAASVPPLRGVFVRRPRAIGTHVPGPKSNVGLAGARVS